MRAGQLSTYRPTLTRRIARILARWPRIRVAGLLAAPVGWLLVFYLGSLAVLFAAAFWHYDANITFTITKTFSFENFAALLSDPVYRSIAGRTVLIAALVTITDAVLAFPIAFVMGKLAGPKLRSVLGVLRDVDGAAPRAPAPGLAQLGDLVDHATAAGLTVRVEEDGQPGPLPADVDMSAYRIIQEALTNTARHSGGTQATVRLGYNGHGLEVAVDDDGPPPARSPSPLAAQATASPE